MSSAILNIVFYKFINVKIIPTLPEFYHISETFELKETNSSFALDVLIISELNESSLCIFGSFLWYIMMCAQASFMSTWPNLVSYKKSELLSTKYTHKIDLGHACGIFSWLMIVRAQPIVEGAIPE